jgi:hypothetical protein
MSDTLVLGKNAEYVTLEGEVASGETVYPGMVVEERGTVSTAGADTPTIGVVDTADKLGENLRVVLPPDTPPHANDADLPIEHEYDAGEHVEYATVYAGRVQNVILAAGNNLTGGGSADVSYDDPIVTNDDGGVKSQGTAGAILGRAREAVDNSGAGSNQGGISGARLDVEVV